jgi:hypothetical protein
MKSTHHLNVSQRFGVVEQAVNVTSTEELIKQTAKRSVFPRKLFNAPLQSFSLRLPTTLTRHEER